MLAGAMIRLGSMKVGVYVRISKDEAEGAGVARQEADARDYAERLGWSVEEVYSDNDASAFQRGVKRPGFEKLLKDAASQRVQVILVYRIDRLARAAREWAKVLPLVDDHEVAIIGIGDGVDTRNSGGRLTLGLLAEIARDESARTSQRIRRAKRDVARAGRGNGGGARAFGHNAPWTSLVPEEAEKLQHAASLVLSGVSLHSAAKHLGWTGQKLKKVLQQPRIAGMRFYDGEYFSGTIPPIISPEDWHRIQTRLPPSGKAGRPPAHLLSGLLVCSACGGKVKSKGDVRKPAYICRTCYAVSISMAIAEKAVDEEVVSFLKDQSALQEASTDISDIDRDAIIAEQEALRGRLKSLTEDVYLKGIVPEGVFRETAEKINARLYELDASLAAGAGPRLGDVDVEAFEVMPVDLKREFLRIVFTRIIVHPKTVSPRLEFVYSPGAIGQG